MPSPAHEMIVQMLTSRPAVVGATVAESRAGFEQLAQMFPLAPDVQSDPVDAGGVPAEWVSVPESRADRAIFYLHGGGYVIGSPNTHRELASRIARATRARALVVDYRLAPEHPFPAAVEDAVAAYRWLLGTGVAPSRVAIAGDSAGGGLTLATLLALRDRKLALPACGVCLSPWVDLEGTGKSAQPGGADDPLLELEGLREMGQHYAAKSLRDPLAAPLHADFRDLPPLLIQVGTRELLLDDSTRVAEKAKAAGVDVTLEPWEGLIHVWQLFGPSMPEAVQAVDRIGEFTRKHTG
jgi:monoterpene epsilon-lactone hydrolase